jgi:hypothetical protein
MEFITHIRRESENHDVAAPSFSRHLKVVQGIQVERRAEVVHDDTVDFWSLTTGFESSFRRGGEEKTAIYRSSSAGFRTFGSSLLIFGGV